MKNIAFLSLNLLLAFGLTDGSLVTRCQDSVDASESILRLTTLVDVHFDDGWRNVGSGFFFQVLSPPDQQKSGPQWRAIKEIFLVTNRHVLAPERFSHLQKLVFYLRRSKQIGADWVPIEVSRNELGKRLHLHPNKEVDVAVVSVLDLIDKEIKSRIPNASAEGGIDIIPWSSLTRDQFPGVSRLKIGTGDDLLVIGYPRVIYDHFNKLPILKRSTLITPWKDRYEGWDAFLIDVKLYEGSSGSLVISKPTNMLFEEGKWYHNQSNEFLFLGIY
jgi:hypothetical protein